MKDERRGFSGFDDLLSDLSDLPEAPPPHPPAPIKSARSQDDDAPAHGLSKAKVGDGPSILKIVLVLGGVCGALVLVLWWSAEKPRPAAYVPPPLTNSSSQQWAQGPSVQQQSPVTSTPKPAPPTMAIPSQTPAPPIELAPEPGQVGVVNTSQLRYCLSQNIRIDGAEKVVDTKSQNAIDRFNRLISDYNSRCGSIQYRKSDFEKINPGIVNRRDALEKEGIALVRNPSKSSVGSTEDRTTKPSPGPKLVRPQVGAEAPPADATADSRAYGAEYRDSRVSIRAAGDDCWIQLHNVDGSMLMSRLLLRGEVFKVPNRPGLRLMAGNAGALEVSIDGRKGPSLGGMGQVRRDIQLDPDKLWNGG